MSSMIVVHHRQREREIVSKKNIGHDYNDTRPDNNNNDTATDNYDDASSDDNNTSPNHHDTSGNDHCRS